ncbi:hypothetical protein [Pseudorhodobacter sp. E13]|nr:hypothetical protein [Pseudorhodobacter sp. E13]
MRFPILPSQSDIDAQLRRAKPRNFDTRPLPWLPALVGLTLVMVMQTLL